MKSSKKSRNLKKIALIALAVLVVIVASVVIYCLINRNNVNKENDSTDQNTTINYDDPTEEQIEAGEATKKESLNEEQSDDTNESDITATVTYTNQSDGYLNVGTLIDSVTNNGQCELTLTKDDSIVEVSSGTQALASSSVCKGFSIPIDSQNLSVGTWNINLIVTIGDKTASYSTQTTIK